MYGTESMAFSARRTLLTEQAKSRVWKPVNVDGHDTEMIEAIKQFS